jgi:hypothetical protein
MATKSERHAAIRDRAERAVLDLYHAATPNYPRDVADRDADKFDAWFADAVSFEIDYLCSGGPYGGDREDYRATLAAPCNAGKLSSEAARRLYVERGLRQYDRDAADRPWFRISELGKLYQWGRGGRTLAPTGVIREGGGGSFCMRRGWHDDMPIGRVVEMTRIVEAFAEYVRAWCAGIPDMWADYVKENEADAIEAAGIELATD